MYVVCTLGKHPCAGRVFWCNPVFKTNKLVIIIIVILVSCCLHLIHLGSMLFCEPENIVFHRWLSVMPLERSQFDDLSAQEFRDGLALRYKKPLLCLPPCCDGCDAPLSIEHALDCRIGGLVGRRHNEVQDAFGDLASLVWNPVIKEPVVSDSSDGIFEPPVADPCVHWVWQPQTEALFDIRVIDTDAQSYCGHTPTAVLCSTEVEKKRNYSLACQSRRASYMQL